MFSTDKNITFENRKYFGAKEIGFTDKNNFVLSLFTTPIDPNDPRRGSYFTTIPISDLEYRQKYGSKAHAMIFASGRSICIYDDFDHPHTITSTKSVISKLAEECK